MSRNRASEAETSVFLPALLDAQEALEVVVRESEHHRFGRDGYDATLDHLYDYAAPALKTIQASLQHWWDQA